MINRTANVRTANVRTVNARIVNARTFNARKCTCMSALTAALLLTLAAPAAATGLATCDSGNQETWQAQDKLAAHLKEKGWQVRRIKVDGGCYEVYAFNEKGERVEAYFHPRTLAPVPAGAKDHKG